MRLCLKGTFSNQWQPDWSKIKYDDLRMNSDGRWVSFNTTRIHLHSEGECVYDDPNDGDDHYHEDHIKYTHPDHPNVIYTRPK